LSLKVRPFFFGIKHKSDLQWPRIQFYESLLLGGKERSRHVETSADIAVAALSPQWVRFLSQPCRCGKTDFGGLPKRISSFAL